MLIMHLVGEVLHVRRLQLALKDLVIGGVIGLFQIKEANNHPYLQRSAPSAIRCRRQQVGELINDGVPGNRICMPEQWMVVPDDLTQAGLKEITTAMALLIAPRGSMTHENRPDLAARPFLIFVQSLQAKPPDLFRIIRVLRIVQGR